jgi:ATP-binding cassette subfamily C protein
LLIVSRMNGPVGQIQQGAQQLAHSLPAYENVKALERDLAALGQSQPAPAQMPPLPEGPIVFDDVSFVHAAENDDGEAPRGVRGISVAIAPGEFIGVSGPSGAGKTTFADLLVGLFPPQQGRISIAGTPLDGVLLGSWRQHIGYVSQDPFLFHDTVRRNLAWANPRTTEAQMWDALALTGAGDLVRRMERGLDTVVGERGTLVSGGERQRIALARAIMREPRLLVLDEATSAIDVAGERDILVRLRALAQRPAIVIIAHRTESLALCDRVLRFDGGRCG